MKVLLISGGHIDEAFAAEFCREHRFDRIIAVDGGLEAAERLGLGIASVKRTEDGSPLGEAAACEAAADGNLSGKAVTCEAAAESKLDSAHSRLTDIVGDFDTVRPEVLEKYKTRPQSQATSGAAAPGTCAGAAVPGTSASTTMSEAQAGVGRRPAGSVEIHQYNPEKDYTDTDIALKLAIKYCQEAVPERCVGASVPETCVGAAVPGGAETAGTAAAPDNTPKLAGTAAAPDNAPELTGIDAAPDNAPELAGTTTAPANVPESEIWILGATGSRLDHVLANISMLMLPLRSGIRAWIVDEHNRICLLSGKMVIQKEESFGKYLSLIPMTPQLSGVTLKGVKYPLNNHTVCLGESLCVSNEITDPEAVIEVRDGIAVVLETRD